MEGYLRTPTKLKEASHQERVLRYVRCRLQLVVYWQRKKSPETQGYENVTVASILYQSTIGTGNNYQ